MAFLQDLQKAASNSTQIGAFVQDSWNFLDKVTVNLGVRYDSQYLFGADGKLGIPRGWQKIESGGKGFVQGAAAAANINEVLDAELEALE